MLTPMRTRLLSMLAALSLVSALSGCGITSIITGGDRVSGDAVVRYVDIEGGFYAIHDVDGHHYDPTNLPAEFKRDGLAVRYSGQILHDVLSVHMYGEVVELTEISIR